MSALHNRKTFKSKTKTTYCFHLDIYDVLAGNSDIREKKYAGRNRHPSPRRYYDKKRRQVPEQEKAEKAKRIASWV
jgi:hypothetical protein